MRTFHPFPVNDIEAFTHQLLQLSYRTEHFCFLNSNNYRHYPYSTFGSFFAIDAIDSISVNNNCLEQLETFQNKHNDWLFGFLNYDLKNEFETSLSSQNFDGIHDPLLHFFVPRYLVKIEKEKAEIGIMNENELDDFKILLSSFSSSSKIINKKNDNALNIQHRIAKADYISSVENIRTDIQRGDIYEMNFCQEFYAEGTIDPLHTFLQLNEISKAPFSCFLKNNDHYLMCASPERFLKRQHNKLISQPIKGTRKRIADRQLDKNMQEELFEDEKERSENIMIVDLVRNDLSKIAVKNSVQVEELFGIYSFEQVHQMISTVTCTVEPGTTCTEIIRNVFPMGSMTGAPKIAAMQLIEKYEASKRGLYSGAVGYITPKGNFDFNVVIRSILYNETRHYISVHAGSAITINCDAEKEYEECLLKAKAMMQALGI
jgi:para-aminobenzoate synthetase component 1